MNDTAQGNQIGPHLGGVTASPAQPATVRGDQVQTPVSLPQKELGPTISAYIEKTDVKPDIPPQLTELGVEHVTDEIEVPYEAQKVGLTHSKEAVAATTEPDGTVFIPLTASESFSILRIHKDITEAVVWLANWCIRQLKIQRK